MMTGMILKSSKSTTADGIAFGAFVLVEGGLELRGTPDIDDFRRALTFSTHAENNASMWKADLLEYARTKTEWASVIDHVIDSGQFTEQSVRQYQYVARSVKPAQRVAGLSLGHHAEVASQEPDEQTAWLTKAKNEDWSVSELRRQIHGSKSRRIASGQAPGLADAQQRIKDSAWLAQQACREISHSDCKHADAKIAEARKYLDQCERQVMRLRKLTGQE